MTTNKKNKTSATAAPAAPATASSSSVSLLPGASPALFTSQVANMDRQELNRLDMKTIPPWARTIVDQERCRRKKQEQLPSIPKTTLPAVASIAAASPTTAATITAVAIAAATVTAVNPAFKLNIPAETSATATATLKEQLSEMDRKDLNMIDMQTTPSWARPRINKERCRRKKLDAVLKPLQNFVSAPEKELKAQTTASAAATSGASTVSIRVPTTATRASIATARTSAYTTARVSAAAVFSNSSTDHIFFPDSSSDDISYLASSSSSDFGHIHRITVAQPRSQRQTLGTTRAPRPPRRPAFQPETTAFQPETADGAFLNDEVVQSAAKKTTSMWDCKIIYDPKLENSEPLDDNIKPNSRDMFGEFQCTSCRRRGQPRTWHSAEIFTRFWYKYTPANGRPGSKDTLRYQSLIYFQKCQRCEKYKEANLDHESYVRRVIKAFELWTERRDREYRDHDSDSEEFTKPHDSKRCRGCIDNLHHNIFPAYSNKGSYQWRF